MANYILTEATARGLQELLAGRKGIRQAKVGQTVADDGETIERPDENAVWRVEWMSSLESFAVYLGSAPLTVNGSSVMPSGVTAAPAPLDGTGWYKLDGFTGGSLWLSVSTDSTTTTAVLSSSQVSGAQNILVATVSTSSATGEVSIAQNLLGALVISGATEGYTGSVIGDSEIRYNSNDSHNIELWGKVCTYDHGLLKSVGNLELQSTIPTTPHVAHDGE